MTLRYLLDTNILAEPVRPTPDQGIMQHLQRHQDEIAIASVVWHEMWFGCLRLPPSARRQVIETYLTQIVGPGIPVLPYDHEAAAWHATQRARLTALGMPPPFADGMIAATAATNNLILVTRNGDDFQGFTGLQIEFWHE